ncbi:aminotransferase [Dasania sp. GY-MA-18]|uniref:Aminotransferase n=1 Tax=Dasania phycosphaerae TaxID=2950436 RepID=A0A9J6RKW1_9GAMM|nr:MULTISPECIES: aminotransferase [Dasania]MCR8922541.1 aminotransferase [Dasania sp. GY-MA-18]MCZ0864969.1 aminotransferase [Dasania phycosphaerae]MCZ0868697.1 aminotransferase [Dasania phycosphaerae]
MSEFDQYNTNQIVEDDKNHFLHPWQYFDSFKEEGALPIAKAEGAYIYDTDGNKMLDAIGGMWCTNIGLGREDMVEAIADQVRQMAYANPMVDMTNIPAGQLAKKLAELAPGDLNHVFLSCGGSTAVDTAFRLIHFYQNCRGLHDKKHIIARKEAYHGSTYAAMSIGGKKADHVKEFDYITDTIHHISTPYYYRAPEGLSEEEYTDTLIKEFEDKIEELGGAGKVAAFFAEPIMGSGGVIVPPKGYIQRMWETCKANDILYVSDEVVTAFGRVGHWFASEDVFAIQPDIITSAKGLTSGYQPLGATIFSDGIWDVIAASGKGRYFAHGFTYSGHPVACRAALKNIEIIEDEKILEHVREVGPYFQQELEKLVDLPIVGEVRGKNFMICIENVANKQTKELFAEELDIGRWITDEAAKRGVLVRPIGHLNVLSPPIILTKEQVDHIVSTLRESIEAVMLDLEKQGLWSDLSKSA